MQRVSGAMVVACSLGSLNERNSKKEVVLPVMATIQEASTTVREPCSV